MYIRLANGKEFEHISALASMLYYDGVQRRTIRIYFDPKKYSIDTLYDEFTEDACKTIVVVDDDRQEFIHPNYSIKIEAGITKTHGLNPAGTSISDTNERASTEPLCYITLAETTLQERMLLTQQDTLDKVVASMLMDK